MNDKEIRSYEMILRVSDFGAEQAAIFPSASLGGELLARISAAAQELGNHHADQVSGNTSARRGTATKAVARAALRKALQRLHRTARSMSQTMPGIDSKFRIQRNMSDQTLLGTAEAAAVDAAPIKNDFIRFAMPADFLEDLNGHIAEFQTALTTQQTGKGHRVMATAAIDDTLEDALSAVRQLDAIVRNTFHDDPARLAAWSSASHVERAPKRKKVESDLQTQEA